MKTRNLTIVFLGSLGLGGACVANPGNSKLPPDSGGETTPTDLIVAAIRKGTP